MNRTPTFVMACIARAWAAWTSSGLALAALSGCLNESTTIAGTRSAPLPDLATPSATTTEAFPSAVPTTTLDRSHWPAVAVEQPRNQVAWSFFGGSDPAWAVARGPAALPPPPPPVFGEGDSKGVGP